MTTEKFNAIAETIVNSTDNTEDFFTLTVPDAAKKLSANGFRFTEAELAEFAAAIKKLNSAGELDENTLDNVIGGITAASGTVLEAVLRPMKGTAFGNEKKFLF